MISLYYGHEMPLNGIANDIFVLWTWDANFPLFMKILCIYVSLFICLNINWSIEYFNYIKGVGLRCLLPLSTIFQLYNGSQISWCWKPPTPGSHWQTLSHNVVSSTHRHERDSNIQSVVMGTDCVGSCKSNYHTITTTPLSYFQDENKFNNIYRNGGGSG